MATFRDYLSNGAFNAVPSVSAFNTPKSNATQQATATNTQTPQITTQPAQTTNWSNLFKRYGHGNSGNNTGGSNTGGNNTDTPATPTPTPTTPTTPTVNPGEWPITTPPYAPMPFTGDEEGLLSWLIKSLPDTYAYMNNGLMDTINQSNQLSNQALQALQAKMNEIAGIFNTQGANLTNAQGEMMSGLTSADQAFGNILNRYTGYIENGTLPEGMEEALNKIRENSYKNIEKRVGQESNSAIKTALNRFGASGMIDSDYFKQAMGDIGAKGFSALSDAGRDIENSYLQSRMAYPFEMFNTVLPQYGNLTTNLRDTAKTAFGSAENVFNDLLKGGLEQIDPLVNYFGLAQQLPGWYDKERSGTLSELMDIFKTLTEKDIAEKQINAQEEANSFDWTDIFF
jgi:hypothetical protein